MKKLVLALTLLFTFLTTSFAGEGIELNNINATWSRVLPGKLICEPKTTSNGFAVITDAHSLMSFTSQGRIVYEKLLVRANQAFFGVLQNDLIAVITGSSKRLTLLNPDGRELWTTQTDFKITQSPVSGRDGRFFVRGDDVLACYSINGIQKWKITTPLQSKIELNELPNGSLILMLRELDGGKTKALRISPFGELEEEIKVAKAILQDAGVQKSGINIISCPTCGRLQSDLVSAIKIVEEQTKHIKAPLNISVMGCVVNALGEAKGADVAIAFGKGNGLVIRHGEIVAKLKESELVERFLQEVEDEVKNYEK